MISQRGAGWVFPFSGKRVGDEGVWRFRECPVSKIAFLAQRAREKWGTRPAMGHCLSRSLPWEAVEERGDDVNQGEESESYERGDEQGCGLGVQSGLLDRFVGQHDDDNVDQPGDQE